MYSTGLTYRIVNYIGNYGPGNFWSNVLRDDVVCDLAFIKENGFNAIILMIPYAAFMPTPGIFANRHEETLDFIVGEASRQGLSVIYRLGYLWESDFQENRTLERYMDMYTKIRDSRTSVYENDFLTFVDHFYKRGDFLHVFLSWEDFFWAVSFANEQRNITDQQNEQETRRFMEYLLGKIGTRERLFVEQRTNAEFHPIQANPKVSYAYYNTLCLQSWDDDFIDRNFGRGIAISGSMLVEKQFFEWYSRMKAELNLGEGNELIIDQFNIVDNTFSDDIDHHAFAACKKKLQVSEENLDAVLEFIMPVVSKNVLGIGFWSLWTTVSGHVYNGTFALGYEGWNSDAELRSHSLVLRAGNKVSTNLGYVRLDNKRTWNILLKYTATRASHVEVTFNGVTNIIEFEAGDSRTKIMKYHYVTDKALELKCLTGEVTLMRVDCFNQTHKSIFYNEDRKLTCSRKRLALFTGVNHE